jgi:hypothetical protein
MAVPAHLIETRLARECQLEINGTLKTGTGLVFLGTNATSIVQSDAAAILSAALDNCSPPNKSVGVSRLIVAPPSRQLEL